MAGRWEVKGVVGLDQDTKEVLQCGNERNGLGRRAEAKM